MSHKLKGLAKFCRWLGCKENCVTRKSAWSARQLFKHSLGRRGESIAANYLLKKYYFIFDRNWRVPTGEIDLIAREDRILVFVEVKTRDVNSAKLFSPLAAIDYNKQRKLQELAERYIVQNRLMIKRHRILGYRFDTIGVIRHRRQRLPFSSYQVYHHRATFNFDIVSRYQELFS